MKRTNLIFLAAFLLAIFLVLGKKLYTAWKDCTLVTYWQNHTMIATIEAVCAIALLCFVLFQLTTPEKNEAKTENDSEEIVAQTTASADNAIAAQTTASVAALEIGEENEE